MTMTVVVIGVDLIINRIQKIYWANAENWTRDLFLTKEALYLWATSAFLEVRNFIEIKERETGFEPATFSLEGWRSTNWATPALLCGESRIRTCEVKNSRFTVCPRWPLEYLPKLNILKNWADGGTRTHDLLITNQLL